MKRWKRWKWWWWLRNDRDDYVRWLCKIKVNMVMNMVIRIIMKIKKMVTIEVDGDSEDKEEGDKDEGE